MAHEPDNRPLFSGLVISDPPKARRSRAMPYSLGAHILVVGLLGAFAIFGPDEMPHTDPIRVLIYNPPPPPPPPLQLGSPNAKERDTRPVTPERETKKPEFTAPDDHPKEVELKPEDKAPLDQQAGDPGGADSGDPEGMEGGIVGGEVGGVPGGVIGGVVGGDGDVMADVDQPPRAIRIVRPEYPADMVAFRNKIQGTVEVDFIIGVDGRVRRAWVVRSIPALDAAAIRAVMQWTFIPAVKDGRPVATTARAPVRFSIY